MVRDEAAAAGKRGGSSRGERGPPTPASSSQEGSSVFQPAPRGSARALQRGGKARSAPRDGSCSIASSSRTSSRRERAAVAEAALLPGSSGSSGSPNSAASPASASRRRQDYLRQHPTSTIYKSEMSRSFQERSPMQHAKRDAMTRPPQSPTYEGPGVRSCMAHEQSHLAFQRVSAAKDRFASMMQLAYQDPGQASATSPRSPRQRYGETKQCSMARGKNFCGETLASCSMTPLSSNAMALCLQSPLDVMQDGDLYWEATAKGNMSAYRPRADAGVHRPKMAAVH